MFKKSLLLAIILTLCGAFVAWDSFAQSGGRVDITPQRIILGPRDRSGELTLLNLSPDTSTIRVSLLNYRQNEQGVYETLETPLDPAFDPEKILRLSPRQFTLPAGGRQTVRFSIRKPADLPDGEYRFHIQAIRMSESGPQKPVAAGEKKIGMIPSFGAAIPVVVRHGKVESSATLSDLEYVASNEQGKPQLNITINRGGNASTFGRAEAIWVPQSGTPEAIGTSSNLNVFTDVSKRYAKIPLTHAVQGPGEFRVVYINEETKTPYANATLQKPQ